MREDQKDWRGAAAVRRLQQDLPGRCQDRRGAGARGGRASEGRQRRRGQGDRREGARAYKQHGKGSDEGSYYAAQARYIQGELVFLEYERIKIAGKPKQLAKVLEEKAKLLEEAKSIYLDVVTYKSPEWATASLLRIGQGYEAFAKAMRNAPVPKDLNEDEKQMYRDELEKVIVVIEDKAIDAYKSGYARALQIGVYNKHTQAIRQALGRLAENEYPKEAEVRLSTRPGEPRVTMDKIEEVRRDQ